MSSFILSHDSHLMMLEIGVENLFVPWTTAFDKVILKKTIVLFRMLDQDWTSLSPHRRDYRPYQGSNYENEKFYGGKSVVFPVSTDFFKKEASGVYVQLYVRKRVCKYFETVSRQETGFVAISVDNQLNSIAKQVRERNELAEHLSDFYKRQIISRSMTGTYTLLDENFRNTAATISLYIRISYLGKCLITEITRVKSIRGVFYTRGDSDEKQPYFSRQLTLKELQSGRWDDCSLPRVPPGRLICRCEEHVKKKIADLTRVAVDTAAIKRKKASADKVADSAAIPVIKVAEDVATIEGEKLDDVTIDSTAAIDSTTTSVAKIAANAVTIKERKILDYGVLGDRTDAGAGVNAFANAYERIRIPIMATDGEVINEQGDIHRRDHIESTIKNKYVKADAAATAKTKGYAIKDNGERTFKKVVSVPNKSKLGRNTVTIGNTERGKKIPPSSLLPFSRLQTYRKWDHIEPTIKNVKADAAATAKTKGYAIKDNGERTFKKAVSAPSKSKLGRNTVTVGITERGKRIPPSSLLPFSRLQTYPLCCQLQPHLTCFTDCFVSTCYCYWTACPLQFFYSAYTSSHEHYGAPSFTATS